MKTCDNCYAQYEGEYCNICGHGKPEIYVGKKATIEYTYSSGVSVGYESGLDKLNPDIDWIHVSVGSYQGDIISLGKDKLGEYWYKMDCYGSCSCCDWVQGIDTKEQAIEFLKSREVLVRLGYDKTKVLEYLKKEQENVYDFDDEAYLKLEKWVNER